MGVVEARQLERDFGAFRAVDGIAFNIEEGECYGFLGPNGAGKTTTVRMIQGLLPRTGGDLTVFGKDIDREPVSIKADLGVVSQENNLDRDLTVRQNLLTYARYFDIEPEVAQSRADELLKFLHLDGKKGDKLSAISGGMQRRLAIARALINGPRLMLLDEPTTGLDPQARHMIWARLRSLKKQKITMILTTHYMEEAERLCDRVAIMNGGKILMEGKPSELVKDVIGEEVIELNLGDENRQAALNRVRALGAAYEMHGDTVYIYNGRHEMLSALVGIGHRSVLHRKATLEDLFLKLAGRTLVD
ncbi:MAG: ABC transporter ATP-binding protein [Nitrospinae bacterium]|nr:ABC transporter ATP-binding protein [Nitrospinota bacterium]